METEPFYSGGLRFSCVRCSVCCRHEPGFVFLSKKDVENLAAGLNMGYTKFVDTYCRWIPSGGGREQLSLREKPGYDCVFWEGGCTVYLTRPLQCRTFPFWAANLASPSAWKDAAASCPGMDKGVLHGEDHIERCLADRRGEPPVSRSAPGRAGAPGGL
jgi:Fe-S-cluster containining protein